MFEHILFNIQNKPTFLSVGDGDRLRALANDSEFLAIERENKTTSKQSDFSFLQGPESCRLYMGNGAAKPQNEI